MGPLKFGKILKFFADFLKKITPELGQNRRLPKYALLAEFRPVLPKNGSRLRSFIKISPQDLLARQNKGQIHDQGAISLYWARGLCRLRAFFSLLEIQILLPLYIFIYIFLQNLRL